MESCGRQCSEGSWHRKIRSFVFFLSLLNAIFPLYLFPFIYHPSFILFYFRFLIPFNLSLLFLSIYSYLFVCLFHFCLHFCFVCWSLLFFISFFFPFCLSVFITIVCLSFLFVCFIFPFWLSVSFLSFFAFSLSVSSYLFPPLYFTFNFISLLTLFNVLSLFLPHISCMQLHFFFHMQFVHHLISLSPSLYKQWHIDLEFSYTYLMDYTECHYANIWHGQKLQLSRINNFLCKPSHLFNLISELWSH